MDTRLMISVERAVRPVKAPSSTKRRMREELYDLISQIHIEEAGQGGTSEEILQRTNCRFGDPLQLTSELQQTVGLSSMAEVFIEQFITRNPEERSLYHALRIAAMMSALIVFLFCSVMVIKSINGTLNPVTVWFTFSFCLMYMLQCFHISWLALHVADCCQTMTTNVIKSAYVWSMGALCGTMIIFLGYGLLWMLSQGAQPDPELCRPWLILGGVAVPLFIGILQAYQWEKRSIAHWEQLQLD